MPLAEDERFMLGQIDANVRAIMLAQKTQGHRITFLERKYWLACGIGFCALVYFKLTSLADILFIR